MLGSAYGNRSNAKNKNILTGCRNS